MISGLLGLNVCYGRASKYYTAAYAIHVVDPYMSSNEISDTFEYSNFDLTSRQLSFTAW